MSSPLGGGGHSTHQHMWWCGQPGEALAVPKATMGREVHGSESRSAIDLLLPTWREAQADGPKAGLTGGNL